MRSTAAAHRPTPAESERRAVERAESEGMVYDEAKISASTPSTPASPAANDELTAANDELDRPPASSSGTGPLHAYGRFNVVRTAIAALWIGALVVLVGLIVSAFL
jgi:hypothetical protein